MLHQRLVGDIRIAHPHFDEADIKLAFDQRFHDPLQAARFDDAVSARMDPQEGRHHRGRGSRHSSPGINREAFLPALNPDG
jgi:hypothetical protein